MKCLVLVTLFLSTPAYAALTVDVVSSDILSITGNCAITFKRKPGDATKYQITSCHPGTTLTSSASAAGWTLGAPAANVITAEGPVASGAAEVRLATSGAIDLSTNINTTRYQSFYGPVTITSDVALQTGTGHAATFYAPVNGTHALSGARLSFEDVVTELTSLASTGTVQVKQNINVAGPITISGILSLLASAVQVTAAGQMTLASITGDNHTLTAQGSSVDVGLITNVYDLTLNAGNIVLRDDITSSRHQTFAGTTLVAENVALSSSSGTVTFTGQLRSSIGTHRDVVINGNASFGNTVGAIDALGSLTVSGASTINSLALTATGTMSFGAVNFTQLTHAVHAGHLQFAGAVVASTASTLNLTAAPGGIGRN